MIKVHIEAQVMPTNLILQNQTYQNELLTVGLHSNGYGLHGRCHL